MRLRIQHKEIINGLDQVPKGRYYIYQENTNLGHNEQDSVFYPIDCKHYIQIMADGTIKLHNFIHEMYSRVKEINGSIVINTNVS